MIWTSPTRLPRTTCFKISTSTRSYTKMATLPPLISTQPLSQWMRVARSLRIRNLPDFCPARDPARWDSRSLFRISITHVWAFLGCLHLAYRFMVMIPDVCHAIKRPGTIIQKLLLLWDCFSIRLALAVSFLLSPHHTTRKAWDVLHTPLHCLGHLRRTLRSVQG